MLRRSDFTLAGKVDRLENHEIKILLGDIYNTFNTSVRFYVEEMVDGDSFASLGEKYYANFIGIRLGLTTLGIRIRYKDEDLKCPFFTAKEIIAEYERNAEVVEE